MRLTDAEKRHARAIFDAMYPSDPEARVARGIAGGDIEGFLDDLADAWEATAFIAVRIGFVMIALASAWRHKTLRPFAALSRAERLAVLKPLYSSDVYIVRQLVTLQKAVAGFLYGAMVRSELASGRAPEVDRAFVAWRAIVPAHRAESTQGAEGTR